MIEVGQFNKLRVVKEKDAGLYLDGEELGEILLPHRYVKKHYYRDDLIEVFLYFDSEDRIIATTDQPYGVVGDFVILQVVSVLEIGAFLDWGLTKDLFVPLREQKKPMRKGQYYIVYIFTDKKTGRLVASSKLDKFLQEDVTGFEEGQKVKLFLCDETDLGYKTIVNGVCWGLLYKNDVFQEIFRGDFLDGYIKKVRDDGKLDVSLQPSGYGKIESFADIILKALQKNDNFLSLHDKTPAPIIKDRLGMSKKNFKKAIGGLYKRKLINLEKDGISLIVDKK